MSDGKQLDAMIAAGTGALAIPLEPAWQPYVRAHLDVILHHAANVAAFPLADEAEPAPVFKA